MAFSRTLRTGGIIAALCATAIGQNPPAKEVPAAEIKGTPARAAATDYQSHAEVGNFALGAEFLGHSVPTSGGILTTEDYVVVEVGVFGKGDATLKLSPDDFSVKINDKKSPYPSQSYVVVFKSLKDPDWEPPKKQESKSKTSFGGGGGGEEGNGPPPVVHIPIEVQRTMQTRVKQASLAAGERPLPQAGLLFFQYRGKVQGIHSVELSYEGPAGKVTIPLQL